MPATSLALIRSHLNLAPDAAEDELLAHYASAAEAWVSSYIGAPFPVAPVAAQAVLLMVAHSYASREAASPERLSSVPYGVEGMLAGLKARVTGHAVTSDPQGLPSAGQLSSVGW